MLTALPKTESEEKKGKAGPAPERFGNTAAGMPLFLQPKSAFEGNEDPLEREADQFADYVVKLSSPPAIQRKCAACAAGGPPCPKCREEEEQPVQRKASELSPAASGSAVSPIATAQWASAGIRIPTPAAGDGGAVAPAGGAPLPHSLRARFEDSFGAQFDGVRLHTGAEADRAAHSVNALAFTRGQDIVFAAGQYEPESEEGLRLLAHELTHVVQQSGGQRPVVQRQTSSAANQSITRAYAAGLDDAALQREINRVRDAMAALARGTPEYDALRTNLDVLEAEVSARTARLLGLNQPAAGTVPRPAGLPLDGGYMLQPVELPPDVADQIPEGRISDLPAAPAPLAPAASTGGAQPEGWRPSATTLATPPAGAMQAANISMGRSLMQTGFAAAGENSVGLVGIPRWTPGNVALGRVPIIPESMSLPGHTALIVRLDGKLYVRGFAPSSTPQTIMNYGDLMAGRTTTPGAVTDDAWLFTKRTGRSVEWAVERDVAEELLRRAANPSQVPGYTFRPDINTSGMNCGLWGCTQVEATLGRPIVTKGGVPVTDLPAPRATGQGPLMGALKEGEIGPLGGRAAVFGEMSTGMKVLKVGGRVFLVIGVAATVYDIASAPPEQRARTAAREVTGFAAGFAAGAAAGLLCGPGALACSIILGLGFGIAGTLVGREVGEGVYDIATGHGGTATSTDPCDRPPPPCPNCHQPVCPPRNRFGSLTTFRGSTGLMGAPMLKGLNDDDTTVLMAYLRSMQTTSSTAP